MSNWPIIAGVRSETVGAGTGQGTAVTANASANTKGSYATLGTMNLKAALLMLSVSNGNAAVNTYRIDIAINTGGSDTIIVPDLFWDTTSGGSAEFLLRVAIPAGASIKVRCQAAAGGNVMHATITGFNKDARGEHGHAQAVSCTDFTNTLPTNTVSLNGTTQTAWTTICASTPSRVSELLLSPSVGGDTTRSSSNLLFEIGIGAAGSEISLSKFASRQSTSNIVGGPWQMPCDIPAGTRLAFRAQAASATTDTVGMSALGITA